MAAYAVMLALGVFLFVKLPGSFVPEEDQSDVMASIELPAGATLQRTEKVLQEVYHIIIGDPAAHDVFQVAGSRLRRQLGELRPSLHPSHPLEPAQPDGRRSSSAGPTMPCIARSTTPRYSSSTGRRSADSGEFGGFDFYLEDRAASGARR